MILARMRRSERERAERARAALGARCASFTGDVVDSVTYVEIDFQNGAPAWDGDPTFDSLDFGAELELRSGRVMGLTWGAEFAPTDFGMIVTDGRIAADTVSRWNVGDTTRWADVVARRIHGCQVIWKSDRGLDGVVYHFPQMIELRFENRVRLFASATETERDWDWRADHVTVFRIDDLDRSVELVRRIGIDVD